MTKSNEYKVTLITYGNTASFTCDDPSPTEKAWNDNKKVCVNQSDGKKCFYNLPKYHTMIIEANK